MSDGPAHRTTSNVKRRRNNVLFLVFPSIFFGFFLGTYSNVIKQTAVFMPGSIGLHFDFLAAPEDGRTNATKDLQNTTSNDSSNTKPKSRTYQSPIESMLPDPSNPMLQRELMKHDRYVVDSLAYIQTFNSAQKYATAQLSLRGSGNLIVADSLRESATDENKITVVLLTVNRAIPYIAVALASLLRGHSPKEFVQDFNVHVCNLEKRSSRRTYPLWDILKERLPFLTYHDWTDKYPELKSIRQSTVLYMEEQRRDYVKALKICKEASTKWCIVFEDDVVFPNRFADKFNRLIGRNDKIDFERLGGNGTIAVDASKVFMVKLFNQHNREGAGAKEGGFSDEKYIRNRYDLERAVDVLEMREKGLDMEEVQYNFRMSLGLYGLVSNAYPSTTLHQMIDFLENSNHQLGMPTDTLLGANFMFKSKKKALEINPSLVNHIGFYSEGENNGASLGLGRLATDVRFQIDDAHR